jgi:hypothetical protein
MRDAVLNNSRAILKLFLTCGNQAVLRRQTATFFFPDFPLRF